MAIDPLKYACMREFLSDKAGFQFALALAAEKTQRAATLARLADDLGQQGVALVTVDLADHPGRDDLATILKGVIADASVSPGAIAVIGMEPHLPDEGSVIPGQRLAPTFLVANMNWQREVFETACPMPLLVWARPGDIPALADIAPDLWHWRACVFDLTPEPPEPPEPDRLTLF